MLKRPTLLAITLLVVAGACARSAYRDIPVSEAAQPATAAQQETYGVPEGTMVLLEVTASSHQHETGPSGAIRYEPYKIKVRCTSRLQLMEIREYRSFGRLQSDSISRAADCPADSFTAGFDREPTDGDTIHFVALDPPRDDWGVLVIANDKQHATPANSDAIGVA